VVKERSIVHVDMDAFYAAVEQRDCPSYRGKPVVVGADPKGGKGRGVVAACSYEARKYGLHSAMPISIAYRKCPHAIFLRGDMKKYARVSRQIFSILERFTPDIEPISIDEAFLDITGSCHLFGTPEETCRNIKDAIKSETGLTASIGMAPNKMTAKIASDLEKPDGLVIVSRSGLLDFLHPLPVGKLWGVGKKTLESLQLMGVLTVGDLAARDRKDLADRLGKPGVHVWNLANGIDPREVRVEDRIKSIGHEHTFMQDETNTQRLEDTLMGLSEKVSRRMRHQNLKGRTIHLKIRTEDFSTYTRAVTLEKATNFVDDIYHQARIKLGEFHRQKRPVRLIGVQVSNLEQEVRQLDLFQVESPARKKQERLHEAVDVIKDRYGEDAIKHRKN
jgi:nucleotidyltransferase/DNA polymerase involved in DNA repair